MTNSDADTNGGLNIADLSKWIRLSVLILVLLLGFQSAQSDQQTPSAEEGFMFRSMGMPPLWKPYISPMVAWGGEGVDGKVNGELNLGVYKDAVNPIWGLLGLVSEGYLRRGEKKFDGGFRFLGASRFLFLQAGADYSFRQENWSFLMSLSLPLRRGGPLGMGGSLRFDWLPGRDRSFSLGLSIPLGQPHLGKTRPKADRVRLPLAGRTEKSDFVPTAELKETLGFVRHAAEWINIYTAPFLDQGAGKDESDIAEFMTLVNSLKSHMHAKDSLYPAGHTFEAEVEVYHHELAKAFSLAVGSGGAVGEGSAGSRIAARARSIILDEVLLPYNRLLGQRKRHDSVLGLGSRGAKLFGAYINNSSNLPAEKREAVMYVFRTLIEYIEENRHRSKKTWGESRLVWLPLHYALRFEDHDSEMELEGIIEKAVEQEFTHANDVHYVINELFQPELERMIHAAEDYHVLWIHDFRGRDSEGNPDEVSYRQTINSYFHALISKVKAYDTTGKMPTYMLFLDQNGFEIHKARLWLALLEDPMGHEIGLSREFRHWEEAIRASQEELRAAVAQSEALQADARRFGREWLDNLIKVHVSVTNPSDLSFRSADFFAYLPFIPDNLLRDHRKIAFYDVTELDPAKGGAIFTGMGVGEHYVGPAWDDRSVLARGPVLVALKDAARDLLLSQGYNLSEIPVVLRPLTKPDNYDDMLLELQEKGWLASAMQVHNTTGFGPKNSNIIKAILYNLMPKGSHLYIPDSLWNSGFWGAMLFGAACRGCVVLVVSPALENAPSAENPQMSRANELFTRFVILQNEMRQEIETAGGLFKTGIYSMDVDVGDVVGKLQALNDGIAQSEVFQRLFPFPASVTEAVRTLPELLIAEGFKPTYIVDDSLKQKAKLHLKTQFFASQRAISSILPLEGWGPFVRKYILARAKQTTGRETHTNATAIREVLKEEAAALIESWWGMGLSPKEQEEVILFLSVGSHNQDYRGMIMDGETMFLIGRTYAMIAFLDFVSIMGQTTWVEDVQQLEELLPRHGGFWRWAGHYLKLAL
ncbi:MAG: hypothetical protein OEV49_02040 [candidate division Zixibacteria bacterium]|nr:hypothetical protein [candidate division Zixibacteria bacterium]MDH3937647.1 hypothetical protein [candidate division Zixibacteria bacterium]MDH4034171.1 hypothetical protein [candidate division Zixibacteria bacterium]